MDRAAVALVLERLRAHVAARHPEALPAAGGLAPTLPAGVAALARVLPGEGWPRGRLSVVRPGVGWRALLRASALAAPARGERAVWVEAGASEVADPPGLLRLRPPDARAAAWAAEELAASGGVGLVVLVGAVGGAAGRRRRMRAARRGGAAVVEVSRWPWGAAVRVGTGVVGWRVWRDAWGEPAWVPAVRLRLWAEGLGWRRATEVELPVLTDGDGGLVGAELGDRRGARA